MAEVSMDWVTERQVVVVEQYIETRDFEEFVL